MSKALRRLFLLVAVMLTITVLFTFSASAAAGDECTHDSVIETPGVEPTCTTEGYTSSAYCSLCGELLYGSKIIKATGHSYGDYETVKSATCEEEGLKQRECTECGEIEEVTVEKLSHSYKTTITRATLTKNGKGESKCTACGKVRKKATIYYPKTIKLSATSFAYDGKVKTPSVIVKDSKGNTLKKDTDYTVKYQSGRKKLGEYAVAVVFKGKYSGAKKLYFKVVLGTPSKLAAAQSASQIKIAWSKVEGAKGYRIYCNSGSGWKVAVKSTTATSYTFKNLKAGKKYTYRVRAYAKNDEVIWGKYSAEFETATRTAAPTLKATSTEEGKATLAWTNVSGESGYEIYYATKKDGTYKKAGEVKANVKKVSVKNLTPGKTYYFKVRSFIKTGSGKVYSAFSKVKGVKVYKFLYADVLTEYRHALAEDYNYDYKYINASWLAVIRSYSSPFCYALYDVNGDGVEEFLIWGSEVINVFTYNNGIIPLFGNKAGYGERAHLKIYTNGVIRRDGSGGAGYHGWDFYKLPEKSSALKFVEGYVYDGSAKGIFYYKTDKDGNQTEITESYYNQKMDYYSGLKEISPTWIKIG